MEKTPKISVITCSVREAGLPLIAYALAKQNFTDYEWVVDTMSVKNPGDYWGVYKAYNRAVKRARGELIVSVQDYTSFNPDALDKFWTHYQDDPKGIVSGVGNKYADDTWTVMTWKDPRERDDKPSFGPCIPEEIEWNFCSIPKAAIYAVGGFDEWGDKYSSLCGLDVIMRLGIQGGWMFYLDQTNKTYSLEHGRLPNWEENIPFNGPWQERLKEYVKNPVLHYLDGK